MVTYGNNEQQKEEPKKISPKDAIVSKLAMRYRFFHPMLEFLEVFASRGGFDIVAGNPPWLKLDFKNEEVAADFFPEVMLHNYGATNTANLLPKLMENGRFSLYYIDELYEYQGEVAFMNATVNYALLKGQQTNLFKCILVNGFDLINDHGFIGMLHQEGVFEDPNGQLLRKEIYKRLRYHFQYENELKLFFEVDADRKFSSSIYSYPSDVNFISMNNLFSPTTIDESLYHSGYGICYGIKKEGKWNTDGHKDRIIHINNKTLRIIANTFEQESDWDCCKLVSIHNCHVIGVLATLSLFTHRTEQFKKIITVCLDETNAIKEGIMRRETRIPDMSKREMIYSGPHIFVGNPLYQNPRDICNTNSDYDVIDLQTISDSYLPNSNYIPVLSGLELRERWDGFNEDEKWMDYYHVALRRRAKISGERTLMSAIIPPNCSHINGIISVSFPSSKTMVEFEGLTSSLILDFYIKTLGSGDIYESRISAFPLGIDQKFLRHLLLRALMLNCLTSWYSTLWEEMWQDDFTEEV